MARKRRDEEHPNHERWLVSYADFITLLFAFFVVMYSISSVNDGKYRVLSETLTDAFLTSSQSLNPIQVGEKVRTTNPVAGESAEPESDTPQEPSGTDDPLNSIDETSVKSGDQKKPDSESVTEVEKKLPVDENLEQTASALEEKLSPLIAQDLVNIKKSDRGLEVEMKSKALFASGSARLSRAAIKMLRDISAIIKSLPNNIVVEGHTDNVPIKTILFPSNWELSSVRAASVVHLLGRFGIDPNRMAAIGYGEYKPIATNSDKDGRQKNRRVSLVIKSIKIKRTSGSIEDFRDRSGP
jgi:chemotaxis protein MotB